MSDGLEIQLEEAADANIPEYLNALCTVYDTAERINPMTKEMSAIKDRLMYRTVRILDSMITGIYNCEFPDKNK